MKHFSGNMRTTKQDFKLFQKECLKWIKKFGLLDWHVEFFHEDWSESRGDCKWDGVGMIASINLNPNWRNTKVSNTAIKRCAFHEVGHLLLGKIHLLANRRYSVTENLVDSEVHSVIRRLENLFF